MAPMSLTRRPGSPSWVLGTLSLVFLASMITTSLPLPARAAPSGGTFPGASLVVAHAPSPAGAGPGWSQALSVPRNWTNITTTSGVGPSARMWTGMTYDAADGYLLLFGGYAPLTNNAYGDTWGFFAGHWHLLSNTGPSPREAAAVIYDALDRYVVLFGGAFNYAGKTFFYNDTWVWSHGSWTNISASQTVSPPPRRTPGVAYDPLEGRVIMFGGRGSLTSFLGDTWAFTRGLWSLVNASTPLLGSRAGPGFDYDASLGGILLFGGQSGGAAQNDTWLFRGQTWMQLSPSRAPSIRGNSMDAYDPGDGVSLLFGGNANNLDHSDLWAFGGGEWTNLTSQLALPLPGPRDTGSIAFDPVNGTVLLFGGEWQHSPGNILEYSDTWTLGGGPLRAGALSDPYRVDAGQQPTTSVASEIGGTPPFNYTWNPGDGTGTEYGQAPTHIYATPGTFHENLTVTDAVGAVSWAPATAMVVGGPLVVPTPWISPTPAEVGVPLTLQVNVSGGYGPASLQWSGLPVGCVSRNATVLSCVPSAAGNSTLVVAAQDIDLNLRSSSTRLSVFPALGAGAVGVAPFAPAVGQVVAFTVSGASGAPPYAVRWTFDDGGRGSGSPYYRSFPTSGTFSTHVFVNDSAGASVGVSRAITVLPPLAGAPTVARDPSDSGVPETLFLSPSGGTDVYTVSWRGLPSGCLTANLTILSCTPTASGTYTVRAWVNDTGGTSTLTSALIWSVAPRLSVTAHASTSTGPAPLSVQFTAGYQGGVGPVATAWYLGDGSSNTQENLTHTYLVAGSFLPTFWANDSGGGSVFQSLPLQILGPLSVSVTLSATSVLVGTSVTVTASPSGGGSVSSVAAWTLNGAPYSATGLSFSYTPSGAGDDVFSVQVRDSYGELASGSTTLHVSSPSPGPGERTAGLTGLSLVLLVAGVAGAAVALLVLVSSLRRRRTSKDQGPFSRKTTPLGSGDGGPRSLPPWPMNPVTLIESSHSEDIWKMASTSGVDRAKMLILTPSPSAALMAQYGLSGSSVYQLSRMEGESNVSPGDVDRIGNLIETHMQKGNGRTVLFEGIERVVDQASIRSTRRLLEYVQEVSTSTRGAVLIALNPTILSLAERRQLEGQGTVLRVDGGDSGGEGRSDREPSPSPGRAADLPEGRSGK
ncbi:MAG: DUF835 domain-containing protein [Euryarchaeota archaeon]|nr:DUF835 domain-containing protein [Euryarchaeota archaeon]MDE1836410.1 DUF835 domain-containing protein [Euryarchaeota archaeon]MDE1879075.1 DUF835 domain-containing protein [Euryarchaeota archaeon]MDE2044158.1 DUF835 domain-containing protein [Thermoplasmata archaeon]